MKRVTYKEIIIFGFIFSITQYASFLLFYHEVGLLKSIFMAVYVIIVAMYSLYLVYREQYSKNIQIFYHGLILIGFAIVYSLFIGGLYY